MKFVRFENYWWQYDENTPKNSATLLKPTCRGASWLKAAKDNAWLNKTFKISTCKAVTNKDITSYEIVEADSLHNLDWTGTSVLDNNSRYGWLDREGNFYGCSYEDHDNQAEFVHNSSRQELEQKGWVHISIDLMHFTGKPVAFFVGNMKNGVIPTEKQLYYLACHKEIYSNQVFCMYEKAMENKKRWHKKYEIEL